jgi:hypothetical protein
MEKPWAVVIVAVCVAVTAVAVASTAGKMSVLAAAIVDKEGKIRVAFGLGDGVVATLADKDGDVCAHPKRLADGSAELARAAGGEQTTDHSRQG